MAARRSCSLLLRVALEVEAVEARDRHVDGQFDRVVGPGHLLRSLHLLGELLHAPAQLVRVAEEAAEWVFRGHASRVGGVRYSRRVRIAEVMTQGVVTAESGDSLQHVGELMRDRNVGSVVICDDGRPVGVITDRDLALAVVADRIESGSRAGDHASRPIVTGEVEMDLEEAVAIMIQHRIRRLPVTQGDGLVGIVTIDDLAVRAGDLHQAQQITAEVAKASLPEFYFHQRGG